jgi:hypothetical protein
VERLWGAVEEAGPQAGPADGHVVDEVPGHGLDVAGELVLVGVQEQWKIVDGVTVPVDIDAGKAGLGGAGNARAGGQVTPGRRPASTLRTQVRTVSAEPMRSFAATAFMRKFQLKPHLTDGFKPSADGQSETGG